MKFSFEYFSNKREQSPSFKKTSKLSMKKLELYLGVNSFDNEHLKTTTSVGISQKYCKNIFSLV